MDAQKNNMMPHLSKSCQGDMLCWITPSACSQEPELLVVADEVSPYRCSDANTYHDYTLDDECLNAVRLSHASGVVANFPEILHLMLEDVYQSGDESIVSWQPHGQAFRVHKKQQFVETVLPTFFGHSNYTSFTRQLNLYCFHRIKSGEDKGAYYHELFLRSQPYRCLKMVRQVVKGDRTKKCSFAPSEPDCYGMPPSKILINGRYEQHKDIAPKPDTKKKVVSQGQNTEEIVVGCTPPTSSKLQAGTIQNNTSWMDSFPLLCGLPYCQEPMGSFVSSLLEAKCSDRMKSKNFDDVSFFSDNCFCERNQDKFLVEEGIEDLVEFDDYQEENDPTSTKF